MKNIVKQFQGIPTPCISDAMQGLNNLSPAIKPLSDNKQLIGRALTVKMPVGDNLAVLRAIREAKPGDVLVIDAKGDSYRAVAGDFVVSMAQAMGINGIVVDGVIRDIVGIKALNYPVFCKGTTVAASAKSGAGEINGPISCGGIPVHPGDIIVGDMDGVVVVPQSTEEDVLTKASAKLYQDHIRAENISCNPEAVKNYLDGILSKHLNNVKTSTII
ncbi:Regulator of RNase E activity RraA [Peribacillus simplex]|uniref:Putative 4-hydroxy-4-methyl-2-oxoglutarate aldolase n=1 Tax=Peribacillus simplex TaxID=1478 RepID=A0A9X8R9W6_9BACI|nr:RraA family protein [Peribacillus simplex]SIR50344.1 Regulator of RNase E activity RraA [Peribacillus simplex]